MVVVLKSILSDLLNAVPIRLYFFFSALIIYGVWGVPTPDTIGMAEVIVAGFLLLSISYHVPDFKNMPVWYGAGLLLAGWFFTVPLLASVVYGADMFMVLRDLVATGFLLMPVLYYPLLQSSYSVHFRRSVMIGLWFIGFCFSLRSVIQMGGLAGGFGPPLNTDYLANSPEVLFSALFCMGGIFYSWKAQWSWSAGIIFYSLILLIAVPVLAMGGMLQRASLGLMAVIAVVWFFRDFFVRPRRAFIMVGLLLPVLYWAWPYLNNLIPDLLLKAQRVGFNNRGAELRTVFSLSWSDVSRLVFGNGWGAGFENPAVGDVRVNYTHSLLSSTLLKSGVLGVVFLLLYIFSLVWSAIRAGQARIYTQCCGVPAHVLLFCLLPSLAIGLLLYANYKSIGYGLILLALMALDSRQENKAYDNTVETMTDIGNNIECSEK